MPSLATALTFFSLALLLGFSPGPDNLFVLLHSARHGRIAGCYVVLGLCTGLLLHTLALALGLAALFAASALAFTLLKLVGASYLAYLAWQAWRATSAVPCATVAAAAAVAPGPWRMYLRGVLMNLTNPKVVFFVLALMPQFVQPGHGSVGWQLFWLGALFVLATLMAFGSLACFAAALGQRLWHSPRAQRWLNRCSAVVFAGLALRLALAQR